MQKYIKCRGHVGRAFTKNLKAASKKEFSDEEKNKYKDKFLLSVTAKCKCKRHKSGCSCLSDAFIRKACLNHFCILQQCKDADEYAKCISDLAQHRSRNIHSWEGGSCEFHNNHICSCGKCKGTPYSTKCPLKCVSLAYIYMIECEKRADAASVIHPEMETGHSNLCEAHFTVLPHFRGKDQSLNR